MVPDTFSAPQDLTDAVTATGVWATSIAIQADNMTPNQLFAPGSLWSNIQAQRQGELIRLSQNDIRGTGLLPPLPRSIQNGILIAFQYLPFGILMERSSLGKYAIETDVARRVESTVWEEFGAPGETGYYQLIDKQSFPLEAERPNDSPNDFKEYFRDDLDLAFSYDAPGLQPAEVRDDERMLWMYANFQEFVRIDIDHPRPAGNIVVGSRASPFVNWHVRHSLEAGLDDQNRRVWKRTTGDFAQTNQNDVGQEPDHIDLITTPPPQ